MTDAGFMAGAREVALLEAGCSVDKRAGNRREGNLAVDRPFAPIESARAPGHDARQATLGRRGDLGRGRESLDQTEEVRRGRPLRSAPSPHARTAAR
jgi:hypothetical protein